MGAKKKGLAKALQREGEGMIQNRRRALWVVGSAVSLMLGVATGATAGPVAGALQNVKPGDELQVFKGARLILKIRVSPDLRYSLVLDPGGYNVRCPNGKVVRVQALGGPVRQNITC